MKEKNRLQKILSGAEANIGKYPSEQLIVSKSNGVFQYYIKNGDKKKYIKKSQKGYIEKIAQREYEEKLIKELRSEVKLLDRLVKKAGERDKLEQVYYGMIEGKRELITPLFISDEDYAQRWQAVEYVGKRIDDNVPEIITNKGERVRSKSEKIIADMFERYGIPYRYEYPLELSGGYVIYPDFNALNKRTRKEYVLEHLGMCDDEEYIAKNYARIEELQRMGYVLGKDLLITSETSKRPLDVRIVKTMIENFLI